MKVLAQLGALSALACVASADFFALKTESGNPTFDGLCVFSYHTGAGLGNAVLDSCKHARPYKFENHRLSYHGFEGSGPGGLDYNNGPSDNPYDSVTINIGRGTKGIKYGPHGFTHSNGRYKELEWVACKTFREGFPYKPLSSANVLHPKLPSNCGKVKLVKGHLHS